MGQDSDKIWTAETLLQPILPKSGRLQVKEGATKSLEFLKDGMDVMFCAAGRNPAQKDIKKAPVPFSGYQSFFRRKAGMGADPAGPAQMVST